MQQHHFERRYLAPISLPSPSRRHRITVRALTDANDDHPSSTSSAPLPGSHRLPRDDKILVHELREPTASVAPLFARPPYSTSSAAEVAVPNAESYTYRKVHEFSLTSTPPLPPPTPPLPSTTPPPPPQTYLPPPIHPLQRSQYYPSPQPQYTGYAVPSHWYESRNSYPPSLGVSHTIAKRKRTIKRLWTPQEDERLRHLARMRPENWNVIAESLPGRTGKQCRERWLNHLRDGTFTLRMLLTFQDRLRLY